MAKRIERSRIESGKIELPRKLGFLTESKVDYLSVTDRDGEFSVEVPVAALSRLVKAKAELKALKGNQKTAAAGHASALQAEKDAHAETKATLAKAERRLKALTKKLKEAPSGTEAASRAQSSPVAKPTKPVAAPLGPSARQDRGKAATSASPAGSDMTEGGSDDAPLTSLESSAPTAPKKVSPKKNVAKAAEAVLKPEPAPQGPAALH